MNTYTISRESHPLVYLALDQVNVALSSPHSGEFTDEWSSQETLDEGEKFLFSHHKKVVAWIEGTGESDCLPEFDPSMEGTGQTPVNCWTYLVNELSDH